MVVTFPPRDRASGTIDPRKEGVDPEGLQDVIEYAKLRETSLEEVAYDYSNKDPWPGDPPEHAGALDPFPDRRGGQNGIVLHDGRVLAE